MMNFCVRVPGSCGEIMQGYWQGQPFLVTCPIDWYTTVSVADADAPSVSCGEKAKMAIEKTLSYLGKTSFPYRLTISSSLPKAKGMASSSADIGAVCVAVAAAFGKTLTAWEIASIAAAIEPTDGVFFNGLVALNYRTGRVLRAFGAPPPLQLAIFDYGGTVDTVRYHEMYDDRERCYGEKVGSVLKLLQRPLLADEIGNAATYSAQIHQYVQFRKDFEAIRQIGKEQGSVGVGIGHSGTVVALYFQPHYTKEKIYTNVLPLLKEHTDATFLGTATLIGGGWHIEYR